MPDANVKQPPVNATPVHAVVSAEQAEKERIQLLRERVRVLRDGALFDRGAIKRPDPNKQYCWVNAREERQTFYQALGWEVVTDPSIGTLYWKKDENRHRRADLVLYQIDREIFLAYEAEKILRNLDLTGDAADEAFAIEMRKHGTRAFKPPVS